MSQRHTRFAAVSRVRVPVRLFPGALVGFLWLIAYVSICLANDRAADDGGGSNHTNPSPVDSDGDGLTDHDEIYYFYSDPSNIDTDGDGKDDGEEAVPYDAEFYFDRAAEGRFAVIDCGVIGAAIRIDAINNQGTLVLSDPASGIFELHPLGGSKQSIDGDLEDLNNRGDYIYRTDHDRDTYILCDSDGYTVHTYPRDMQGFHAYEEWFGHIEVYDSGIVTIAVGGIDISNCWLDDSGGVSFHGNLGIRYFKMFCSEWNGQYDIHCNTISLNPTGLAGGASYLSGALLPGTKYTTQSSNSCTYASAILSPPSLSSVLDNGTLTPTPFASFLAGYPETLERSQVVGVNHDGDSILLSATLGAASPDERLIFSDGTVYSDGNILNRWPNSNKFNEFARRNGRLPGQPGWWKHWLSLDYGYPAGLSDGEPGKASAILDGPGGEFLYIHRIAANGLLHTYRGLWRNGRILTDREILGNGSAWSNLEIEGLSDNGTFIAATADQGGQKHALLLLKMDIVPDWNRDGEINQLDRNKATDSNPFRFWINDDDDSGEVDLGILEFGAVDGEDVPGQGNDADANDGFVGRVDGMRDLVDFFPLFFDLEDFLDNFDDPSSVELKLSGTGMRFIEYGSDFGGFAPDEAGDYLRDVMVARELVDFDTRSISEDEVNPTPLGDTFRDLTAEGRGVLLLESYEATTAPLVLHVFVDNNELFTYEFHLETSGVEEMFFLQNITDVTKEYDNYDGASIVPNVAGEPTRTTAPNWPDDRTNGKYLVYLHGFKVNGQQARGEHAECFKRLHQMGSNTRFVGVNWHGAYNVDYHKGVFNALQTGHHLNGRLGLSGDVSVIAHSLGNMVVSNAIQNGGFRPDRYFMMNAAVAIEAYSGGNMDTDMVESEWISFNTDGSVNQSESISEDEYASNWYQLFNGTSDDRNAFSWKDYFDQVPDRTSLHNFYSIGENVLHKIPGSNDASIVGQILEHGFDFGRGTWKRQELVKGTAGTGLLSSLVIERAQAGWSLNGNYPGTGDLKQTPRFDDFLEADLTGADAQAASDKASEEKVLYDVLARGVPALSHAAAVAQIPPPPSGTVTNFSLQVDGKTGSEWPTEGHGGEDVGDWLHSDFRSVALPYLYPLYDELIRLGGMDDE